MNNLIIKIRNNPLIIAATIKKKKKKKHLEINSRKWPKKCNSKNHRK